jgi:acyl-CoA hydrolase
MKYFKFNTSTLFKLLNRPYSKRIHTPGSMIFQHKKELENLQKTITKMNIPKKVEEIKLGPEDDFEPGINHFFENLPYTMKIANASNNKSNEITPDCGWVSLYIPLDKETKFQESFKLLETGRIRYGKLLELLDYLSAFTACRMNTIKPRSKQATIVTASVDSIWFYSPLTLDRPIHLTSYPIWTGESSMEIRIDIYNDESATNLLGSAYFVYVLRDPSNYSNKIKTKSLTFEGIENSNEKRSAMLRYEIGKENLSRTKQQHLQSLSKGLPDQEEIELLYNLFINKSEATHEYKTNKKGKNVTNVFSVDECQWVYFWRLYYERGY